MFEFLRKYKNLIVAKVLEYKFNKMNSKLNNIENISSFERSIVLGNIKKELENTSNLINNSKTR